MAKPNYFLAWLGHEAPAGRLSEQSGSILDVSKRAYATVSERVKFSYGCHRWPQGCRYSQSTRALDWGGGPPSGVDRSHDRREGRWPSSARGGARVRLRMSRRSGIRFAEGHSSRTNPHPAAHRRDCQACPWFGHVLRCAVAIAQSRSSTSKPSISRSEHAMRFFHCAVKPLARGARRRSDRRPAFALSRIARETVHSLAPISAKSARS
jgi:hypothetical protein